MAVNPYRNPSYFWRIFLLSAFFFILGCAPVDKRGGISSAQAIRLGGVTVPTDLSMDLFEVPNLCASKTKLRHNDKRKSNWKTCERKSCRKCQISCLYCVFDYGRNYIKYAHQCRRYPKCVEGKSACCLQWPPGNVTIKSSRFYII